MQQASTRPTSEDLDNPLPARAAPLLLPHAYYMHDTHTPFALQVVCPFRSSEERALPLRQMGDLGQVTLLRDWHISDDEYTRQAIAKSDIVVNLVGAHMETRNFTFEQVG